MSKYLIVIFLLLSSCDNQPPSNRTTNNRFKFVGHPNNYLNMMTIWDTETNTEYLYTHSNVGCTMTRLTKW